MDDKELVLLVAKDSSEGLLPKEVEADLELGEPKSIARDFYGGRITSSTQLARVALQIWKKRTTAQQLVAALEATATSAYKIDEQMREEIIQRIVDRLTGKVAVVAEPCKRRGDGGRRALAPRL